MQGRVENLFHLIPRQIFGVGDTVVQRNLGGRDDLARLAYAHILSQPSKDSLWKTFVVTQEGNGTLAYIAVRWSGTSFPNHAKSQPNMLCAR